MRIAVVGCGGIGGYIAGTLARRKLAVTCVEANDALARALGERGIAVESGRKVFSCPVRSIPARELKGERFDLVVVAVKSFDLRNALSDAAPALEPEGFFLAIQNGLEILSIVREDPSLRVVAGAVGFNSIMLEPGRYRLTSRGGMTVGPLGNGEERGIGGGSPWARGKTTGSLRPAASAFPSERAVGLLKELFEPEIPIRTAASIEGVLWGKLIITCGVTGLGGVSGLLLGELMRRSAARRLFYRIAMEGTEVAGKAGVRIEKLAGAVNAVRFSCGSGGYPLFVRYLLLRLTGMKYKNLKSNIHHSLEKGNRTEIDYINGTLAALGKAHGVPTPVNGEVVRMVKEIEAGERSMSAENLSEILARVDARVGGR